jgi:hypothetical protein
MRIMSEEVTVSEGAIERVVFMAPDAIDAATEELAFAAVRQTAMNEGHHDGVKTGFFCGCVFASSLCILAVWCWR